MAGNEALYMGLDLSTQQLKGIVVDSNLKLVHEAKVDFDADLGKYGIVKGVLTNPDEGEVFAPAALWLEAVNLLLDRLTEAGLDFSKVQGVSGAGMQHGTVFWSKHAEALMPNLDPSKPLVEQLTSDEEKGGTSAFAHPMSPNWQDASTQVQCDAFDIALGNPQALANATGSKAHHRFSGPQIMRYRTKHAEHYAQTVRISLVSSFLASIFLGEIAPIDIGDVAGMNLFDLGSATWNEKLLSIAAGGDEHISSMKQKLGEVALDGGAALGSISKYFVQRYGFPSECRIIPFTGDNPATICALPLRAADAIVSLGTSTTFLMSTGEYKPDPAYHFMAHPCERGLYMFMLCYKNGGLAREQVRDQLNGSKRSGWEHFNSTALATPPVSQQTSSNNGNMRLGLYFPRPEIVPNVRAGQWRYAYDPKSDSLSTLPCHPVIDDDARNIIESQMLSLRLRSQKLVNPIESESSNETLPAQPRRVYMVGGGSANHAIAQLAGEVLGGVDGIFRLDIGGNACALGAAYKAVWGCERSGPDESFTSLIGSRWNEGAFVQRIADGYSAEKFEIYGRAVRGFELMENEVLAAEGQSRAS